jgi:hypothetical protein
VASFPCTEVTVSFARLSLSSSVSNPSNFLPTVKTYVGDPFLYNQNQVRGLMDPGAQLNIISSRALTRLQCPQFTRNPPVRISGLRPDKDLITDQVVEVRLRNRFTSGEFVTFTAVVVPDVEWKYTPPRPVCFWLQAISPVLADPDAVDNKQCDLPFHIIFSVDETNLLETDEIPYKVGGFKISQTFFGQTLGGGNPPYEQVRPQKFAHPYHALIEKGANFERLSPARGSTADYLHSGVMDVTCHFIQNASDEGYIHPMAELIAKEKLTRVERKRIKQSLVTDKRLVRDKFEESLMSGNDHPENLLLTNAILDWIEGERTALFEDENLADEVKQDVNDIMDGFARLPDGRLSVRLPKNEQCRLPLSHNVHLNRKRLESTKRRCERTPKFYEGLKSNVETWIAKGFMVPVTARELEDVEHWTELPYHGVMRESESEFVTTKFRVVMDGSAGEKGKASVNDFLRTGSNILPKILSILTKFRQIRYFVVADIEKAFLQLALQSPDDHLFIFRWIILQPDGSWTEETYRFVRMPWGINCAPCVLNVGVRFSYKELIDVARAENDQRRVKRLELLAETTYVDDIVALADTVDELHATSMDMLTALEASKMHVTKIRSFPPQFVHTIDPALTETTQEYKLLGVKYHPETDEISISSDRLGTFAKQPCFTKRHAAGVGARVHSPDGLAEPAVLRAKFLFQETNLAYPKLEQWGSVLNEDLQTRWKELVQDLLKISTIRFPRMVSPRDAEFRAAVLFTDASGMALGGCVYVVSRLGTKVTSHLAMAKSHAVPLKKQDVIRQSEGQQKHALRVNRLELHAISTGAELLKSYLAWSAISFDLVRGFTDSEVCLHWLQSSKGHHTEYVQKRVDEAVAVLPRDHWAHVKGEDNPADVLSRGCSAADLVNDEKWFHGPAWLLDDPALWPTFKKPEKVEGVDLVSFGCCSCETSDDCRMGPNYRAPSSFTTWTELVLSTIVKLRATNPDATYEEAETLVIRTAQAFHFERIYLCLAGKIPATKVSNADRTLMDELGLFMGDRGLIWSRSRNSVFRQLQKQNVLPVDKDLILFPSAGFEARLMLKAIHETDTGHGSPNVALASLRTKFWMPKARALLKSIRSTCPICRLLKSKAFWQREAPLPEERYDAGPLHRQRAFDACGLDHVGAFYPFRSKKIGRKFRLPPGITPEDKRYILVFSCALTRAIHLEYSSSTGFEDFVLAFERFTARHGQPRLVYSDNAGAFTKAAKFVVTLPIEVTRLIGITYPEIGWKFNVPRGPWWGGFYERMMTMVKTYMAVRFQERSFPSDAAFNTAVAVVQKYVNSRPLVLASDSDRDNPTFLTPNHFLQWQPANEIFRAFHFDLSALRTNSLTEREMKDRQISQESFHRCLWDDFQNRYLGELRKFHGNRARPTGPLASGLKVGASVLVPPEQPFKQSKYYRLSWPVGTVVELPSTRDTRYRPVVVEIRNQDGKIVRLTRPAQKLYFLEPCDDLPEKTSESAPNPDVAATDDPKAKRK